MSNHAASTRPPKCLSLESKAHRKARLFHTSGTWVPRGTPPPRDERSLTVRGPVRGSPRRARSFGDCLSSRAGSAVPRDGNRRFIRLNRALSLAFYADSCNQKINASNQNARVCLQTVRVFHARYFRFSPRGGGMVETSCPERSFRLCVLRCYVYTLPRTRFWLGALSCRAAFLFRTTLGVLHLLPFDKARFRSFAPCVACMPVCKRRSLHHKIIASRSPNTPCFCLSNRFFANSYCAIDCKVVLCGFCNT